MEERREEGREKKDRGIEGEREGKEKMGERKQGKD